MSFNYGYFEEDHLPKVGEIRLWRRIMRYVAPYWKWVAGAVLLASLITVASLALPYIIKISIDGYITNQELVSEERLHGLVRMAMIFISFVGLEFLAKFLQVVLLEWAGQWIMHNMRRQLFSHLIFLDLAFFNTNPVGKLVTRLTNDIQNMQEMFTSVIVTIFNDLIKLVGILTVLYWMNWRLALVMSALLPLVFGNVAWFSRLARNAFRRIRTQLAKINSYLQESLSGIAIIQLFLREKDTLNQFKELNEAYFLRAIYQIKIFGIFMPMIEMMNSVAIALIIWYGGGEVIRGNMSLGVLVAFIAYMRLFFQPMRELSQKYSIVQSAMASAERIFQLLDTKCTLPVVENPKRPQTVAGEIEFCNVTFGYEPDQPILKNFSLKVKPGETLAIVGATGSGKTTVINLLERLYDPDKGEILFAGQNLREFDLNWLRSRIGLVLQDIFLIPASIRENILLDHELDEATLQDIVYKAQLNELLSNLPDGLETKVGEGGMQLSAGQQQLLSFARVLARNCRILVLDEATSNVDTETETLIEKAIATTLAGRTSIVIAHRLSTIRRADRIIVMAGGEIVEQGNHAALMNNKGLYYQLQIMQNNECQEDKKSGVGWVEERNPTTEYGG
ncbi:MAG: ABC transporter ATP-binding protein [Thermodesulfobacteriota bacterium]|nr:ABC transporter ATP-binding protein [Thermodesulfobacteriota bacterium]